jgi:hypothetical protein
MSRGRSSGAFLTEGRAAILRWVGSPFFGQTSSYAENPDESKALTAGGECAQRVSDMPKVEELFIRITRQAREILETTPSKVLA